MNRQELAAVRELLTAIRDALEDLPVRDQGNATSRWAAAYCNATFAADRVGLAEEGKLLADESLTGQLAHYAEQIRASLTAQAPGSGAVGDGERAATCPKCGKAAVPMRAVGDKAGVFCLSCGPSVVKPSGSAS